MVIQVLTPPTVEPVSLTEVKTSMGLGSGSYADEVTVSPSIAPGSHAVAVYNGASADVLGKRALILWDWAGVGAGSTVALAVQESSDNAAFTAVAATDLDDGAFATVTTATANAVFEREYLGAKRYLRTVATVTLAASNFGVAVHANAGENADDTDLTEAIVTARELVESHTGRSYIDRRLALWLDAWPTEDYLRLPRPPLSTTTAPVITYFDEDGVEATFAATNWTADSADLYGGLIYLKDGCSWPSTTLRAYRGVCVAYTAGYGATAASVPSRVKTNVKRIVAYGHTHAGAADEDLDAYVARLPWPDRLVRS